MILDKQVLMKVNNRTAQKYKDKGIIYDIPEGDMRALYNLW